MAQNNYDQPDQPDQLAPPRPPHNWRGLPRVEVDNNDLIATAWWISRQQKLTRPVLGTLVRARVAIRISETQQYSHIIPEQYRAIPSVVKLYQQAAQQARVAPPAPTTPPVIPVGTVGTLLRIRPHVDGQYLLLVRWAHTAVTQPQWVESRDVLPAPDTRWADLEVDAAAVRVNEREYQRQHPAHPQHTQSQQPHQPHRA